MKSGKDEDSSHRRAGFIGSNFIFYMEKKYPEQELLCVDKLTYAGNLATLAPVIDQKNFKFIRADIADRDAVNDIFVKTMLRLAEIRSAINIVCDQIGSPTYTVNLAPLLCDMIETEKYSVYHATNEGVFS